MENSTKFVQVLILTVVMAFGVVAGTSFNAYANPEPCGTCDYDDATGLEFCNFNWDTGQCGGNDGGPCGGVAC